MALCSCVWIVAGQLVHLFGLIIVQAKKIVTFRFLIGFNSLDVLFKIVRSRLLIMNPTIRL